jgi:thymidylate kinase
MSRAGRQPKGAGDGRLFILEGPDGVGKSTIAKALADELSSAGRACELMTFPGREPRTLGRLVYDVHHAPADHGVDVLTAASKQALHIAAHLDAIERRILPALHAGRDVVLDRFWWSTWAYGIVGGMGRRLLGRLIDVERAAWGRVAPHTAVLLRRPSPINRPEEKLANWRLLAHEYGRLAARESRRYPVVVVDNEGPVEAALAKVVGACLGGKAVAAGDVGEIHDGGVEGVLGPGLGFAPRTPTVPMAAKAPDAFAHLLPTRPTAVFDTYWRFAAERQSVFFARARGAAQPWTNDPVLRIYKFTNAYRASDRVSQYLIRRVIYREDLPETNAEVFFRIILFKLFNKIGTWELLERALGPVTYDGYSFDAYDRVLGEATANGRTIYSAAYIMPTGGRGSGEARKHRLHLRLVERMMADELPKKLADARSMRNAFELLLAYPTIGDFLAYQYATDVNYSTITDFSEMEFVVPGPGALDGIRKCFLDRGGLGEAEIVRYMADIQDREFARLGVKFQSLWGRPLQLIDCQNLFCETDKYARVVHPDIPGLSGRTRIKQKFAADPEPIRYWYPPKWKLNERIRAWESGRVVPPTTGLFPAVQPPATETKG